MAEPIIRISNVWKIYNEGTPSEVQALKGVNLDVKKGEMLAIVGASGSGKSTLLNMIGALDKPTRGKIFINGKDVQEMSQSQLATLRRKNIGFIFQSFNLINTLSALKNVELPMSFNGVGPEERRKRAEKLLTQVGLASKFNQRPTKLSGGESQRVAIARALANDPNFILADEPTGNLDSVTGKSIIEIFKNLNKDGRTIIIITHDLGISKDMKRTVRICDGRVAEHGCAKNE